MLKKDSQFEKLDSNDLSRVIGGKWVATTLPGNTNCSDKMKEKKRRIKIKTICN